MSRNILNVSTTTTLTGIINITRYKNYSRSGISAVSDGRSALVNTTFTKLRSNSESFIQVAGIIPMQGMPNYPQIGCSCTIDDLYLAYDDSSGPRNGAGGGGFYYCGPDRSVENTLGIVHKSFKEWNIAAGSHSLKIGWYSNEAVRCCEILNPNNADNDRHHQSGTHILIYEIAR
jgi:hypothetical protein